MPVAVISLNVHMMSSQLSVSLFYVSAGHQPLTKAYSCDCSQACVWAIAEVIFNYTGSPGEKIPQKVLRGYFFDSHCIYVQVCVQT